MASDNTRRPGEELTPERHENKDPITGTPGAHPVGVGIGAATLGAVGAAIGSLGGPLGAIAGAAAGSYLGGYGGKYTAEAINPTLEDHYWRENYRKQAYVRPDVPYDQYHRAYKLGWEGRMMHGDKDWTEVEPVLKQHWEEGRGDNALPWEHAKLATHDAWHRIVHRDDPPGAHAGETAEAGNESGAALSGSSEPRSAAPERPTTGEEVSSADGDGEPSEAGESGTDAPMERESKTIH